VRDSDTDTADKRSLEARPRPRDGRALAQRAGPPLRPATRAPPLGSARRAAATRDCGLINNNMFTMSEHSRLSRMDTLHIDIETTDIPSTVQRFCERETKLLFQRQRRFLGRY
jgi:hypothetical protein